VNAHTPAETQIYETAYRAAREAALDDAFDLSLALQRRAQQQTCEFVERHLPLHLAFRSHTALIERCLELTPADGLVLEFGVYKGRSINLIAERLPDRTVHGFDSFEGLPEPWLYRRDAFGDIDGLPAVRDNVELIAGWFDRTLPPFLSEHTGHAAFIHVDSDLYASARTILMLLRERIHAGTVILFDEYFNYPGWKEGEHKAFTEFVAEHSITFEYIGFSLAGLPRERREREGQTGHQLAVRILSTPWSDPVPPVEDHTP